MTIKKHLAHPSNYESGKTRNLSDIKYLVVHYTGNDGDSDEGNAGYFQGANRGASAHYFVDDDSVTQSVPDENTAWSVGKDYSGGKAPFWGKCTNANSINVEMCDAKKDGKLMYTEYTYKNTIELCKMLIEKYKIPIDNVLRHGDVCGKLCPAWFVGTPENESDWLKFKANLQGGNTPDAQKNASTAQKTPIQGKSELAPTQLAAFSANASSKLNCSMLELAQFYVKEGETEGIRGDLAFCQALWETGNFNYGGQVPPEANNYCGLGAFNGTTKYASFRTPQEGVRAHIQHLKAYASKDELKTACVDPRFANARALAVCPNWEDLNGKWAVPGDGYGENIVKLWQSAKAFKGMLKNPYTVRVVASSLNVRKGAGTSFDIVQTVKKGEIFTIVEENGGWGKLKSGVGWINLSSEFVVKN